MADRCPKKTIPVDANFLAMRPRKVNSRRSSTCAEHRKEVVPCCVLRADGTPLRECLLCEGDRVLHIGPDDVPRQVVVGSVAIRLELAERGLDIHQVSL